MCQHRPWNRRKEDFEALGAVLQFARQAKAKAKEEIPARILHLEARMCFAFWRERCTGEALVHSLNAGAGSAMLMQRMSSGTLVLSPI